VARFGCGGLSDESVLVSKMKNMAEEQYQRTYKTEQENQLLQDQVHRLEASKATLEKKLSEQQAELAELSNSHTMLENQHAALNDLAVSLQGLHEELQARQGEVERVDALTRIRQEKLEERVQLDLTSWRELRKECEAAQEGARGAILEARAARIESEEAIKERDAAQGGLKQAESANILLNEKCSSLQQELEAALADCEAVKGKLADSEAEKRVVFDRESVLRKEIQELQAAHAASLCNLEATWENKLSQAEACTAAVEVVRARVAAQLVEAGEARAALEVKVKDLETKDAKNSAALAAASEMHKAAEREAMLRNRDHAAERDKLKGEIASLEKHLRSSRDEATGVAEASEQAQLELTDLKERLGEMQGALEAKVEALGKSELAAEAAEQSARSHAQRAEALEAEKQEMAAALQEARDEKEKFKGEVSAHNSEALKKIEHTWKLKLAAKQAEVDAGLEDIQGLTEKVKAQEAPAKPSRRTRDAGTKHAKAKWAGKLLQESEKVACLRAELKRAQDVRAIRSPMVNFSRANAQRLSLSASEQSQDCMDAAFELDSGTPETTEAAKPKKNTTADASTGLHGLKTSFLSRDADSGGRTRVIKRPQNRQIAMKASNRKKSRTSDGTTAEKGCAMHLSSRPQAVPAKNGRAGRSQSKSGQVLGTENTPLPAPSKKKRGGAANAKGGTKTVRFASPKPIGMDAEADHEADHDMFGEGSLDPYSIENFF